jgi:hypothetical protein
MSCGRGDTASPARLWAAGLHRQIHPRSCTSRQRPRLRPSIFLRDGGGRRPVYGGTRKFQDDTHWCDLILFYEYFHGDNGAGLGASHPTGWTDIVARGMHLFATTTAEQMLLLGKQAVLIETESTWGARLAARV